MNVEIRAYSYLKGDCLAHHKLSNYTTRLIGLVAHFIQGFTGNIRESNQVLDLGTNESPIKHNPAEPTIKFDIMER